MCAGRPKKARALKMHLAMFDVYKLLIDGKTVENSPNAAKNKKEKNYLHFK